MPIAAFKSVMVFGTISAFDVTLLVPMIAAKRLFGCGRRYRLRAQLFKRLNGVNKKNSDSGEKN